MLRKQRTSRNSTFDASWIMWLGCWALVWLWCYGRCFAIVKPSPLVIFEDRWPQHSDQGRVLILGDSHTYGAFGRTLEKKINSKLGFETVTLAICPAAPETYLEPAPRSYCGLRVRQGVPGKKAKTLVDTKDASIGPLPTVLASIRPQIVLIALGTNMGWQKRDRIMTTSQDLVDLIARTLPQVAIYWLGPPNYGGSREIRQAIQTALDRQRRARFIDGAAFNRSFPLPGRDPHFGPKDARRWGRYMFDHLVLAMKKSAGPPKPVGWLAQSQRLNPCYKVITKDIRIPMIQYVKNRYQSDSPDISLQLSQANPGCTVIK